MLVILAPPLRIIVPIILTSIIPANRYKLLSTFRRRQLVSSITPTTLIRVCKNYKKARRPEKYKVGGLSDRCVEYARLGYSCDLALFSPAR